MSRERFVVVVHVLIVRDGQLFMLRRANTGFMDGYYALPGGHQEAGESVQAAAQRECVEETSVVPDDIRPVCVMPYRSGRHQGLNFIFETSCFQGEPTINEPDLFDAGIWVDPAELPDPVAVWLPDVLAMRAQGDWYREFEWD